MPRKARIGRVSHSLGIDGRVLPHRADPKNPANACGKREPKYAEDEREDESDSDRGAIRWPLPCRGSQNQRSGEREQGGAEHNERADSNHPALMPNRGLRPVDGLAYRVVTSEAIVAPIEGTPNHAPGASARKLQEASCALSPHEEWPRLQLQ